MKTKDERKRVAVVDDDASVRSAAQVLLESCGLFQVVTRCTCGRDALAALTDLPPEEHPQLVLLDIRMPKLDGIACCHELRTQLPGLVIAMFSARRLPCFVNGARHAGADAYFWKGMEPRGLAGALGGLRHTAGMRLGPGVLLGGVTGASLIVHDPRLSPRMEAVLEMEAQGFSVKQIADHFHVSEAAIYKLKHEALSRIDAAQRR